ncbi:MAG TPA: LicD family protein, partial [Clostridium sp.]|nr:LicD family protein [Clostridium sp.]
LTFLYGDYMKLPPVEQRKVHPVSKIAFSNDD